MTKTKSKWEKSSQALIDTFYAVMENFPDAQLKKMFGYPCAFLNGYMFIGLHEENLVLRLSPEDREEALENKWGDIFAPMKGRVMKQYVTLSRDIIYDTPKLKSFVKKSIAFVETLPSK